MGASRPSQTPPRSGNPPRPPTPPNGPVSVTVSHSQTSLPSIHQLHPDLPPSRMSQHLLGAGDAPVTYSYSGPPPHPSTSLGQHEQHTLPLSGPSQESSESYGGPESEPDDGDQQGPPKKKRRRQALSCTGKQYCCHYLPLASCQLMTTFHPHRLFVTLIVLMFSLSSTSRDHMFIECKRRKIKCDRYVYL